MINKKEINEWGQKVLGKFKSAHDAFKKIDPKIKKMWKI